MVLKGGVIFFDVDCEVCFSSSDTVFLTNLARVGGIICLSVPVLPTEMVSVNCSESAAQGFQISCGSLDGLGPAIYSVSGAYESWSRYKRVRLSFNEALCGRVMFVD